MSVSINTNYTGSYMSEFRRHVVYLWGFLKIGTIGFFFQKLYTFMFGHQPSVEANTRLRTVCHSISWWSNGLKRIPHHSGDLRCTSHSPIFPTTLHCQLFNKVKKDIKIIFKKKDSLSELIFTLLRTCCPNA